MTLDAGAVAHYLSEHPEFFEQHPELLSALSVPHPQNGQAISLVERQSLLLRGRIGALEAHVSELKRHGADNDVLLEKMIAWARALLAESDATQLPRTAVEQMKSIFSVPHAAIRVWDVAAPFRALDNAAPVSDDVRRLASSMMAPFAGANAGFEVAGWMHEDAAAIRSLAMLPLRVGASPEAFGMLVLGSADRERFQAGMSTDFLARLAELTSAALSRLRAAPAVA
jgi:hypothetical protein